MSIPASDMGNRVAATCANGATSSTANSIDLDTDGYRTATLPDGRKIEYLVEGDPDGFPLVFHHGTPGAAVPYLRVSEAARERGLALVFPSRPGYGESTPRPGHTVADF